MDPGSDIERSLARENLWRRQRGLERKRTKKDVGGQGRHDFASSDFLDLRHDPRLRASADAFASRFGNGARASRLLGGSAKASHQVESAFRDWQNDGSHALLFASGFQANVSVIPELVGRGDVILSDELCHASLIDGMRMSRALVQVHRHLDLDHLEERLVRSRGARRRLIVTESVFSMDGDGADIPRLAELCRRHDAWLLVDEAHAGGILGPHGRGVCAEHLDVLRDVSLVRLVTGGKALGVSGAFVVGGKETIRALYQRARGHVYSTGVSPLVCGALCAAIGIVRDAEEERRKLFHNRDRLAKGLGVAPGLGAIVPYHVGAPELTMTLSKALYKEGFDVRGVRPPTVPEGTSRLRFVAHQAHEDPIIDALVDRIRQSESATTKDDAPITVRPEPHRPLFVVGTDTDAGKTVASAILMRIAKRLGPARYFKPMQTGRDDSDTRTVAGLAGLPADELFEPIYHFDKPASPHEAAREEGARVDRAHLEARYAETVRAVGDARLVVELAGGLLVPYDHDGYDQSDFLVDHAQELVLVARSGLGTLNHTRLTLEALANRGLKPRALLLVGEPHASNRATLANLVEHTIEIPRFDPLTPEALEAFVDERLEPDQLTRIFR